MINIVQTTSNHQKMAKIQIKSIFFTRQNMAKISYIIIGTRADTIFASATVHAWINTVACQRESKNLLFLDLIDIIQMTLICLLLGIFKISPPPIKLPNSRQVLYSEPPGKLVFNVVNFVISSHVPAAHQLQEEEPHSKALHAGSFWHVS